MHQSVLDFFPTFTERFEGRVNHMYLDVLGLVTTGLGCLIDPVHLATAVTWVHKDGTPATQTEVAEEWQRIKARQDLAKLHYKYAGALCQLRLTDEGINALMRARMNVFEGVLAKVFPEWHVWPADAQLGLMSMSWAMGAGFTKGWPAFTSACRDRRWIEAAENCSIRSEGNPGVIPRNKANKVLFRMAALAYGPTAVDYDPKQVSRKEIGF